MTAYAALLRAINVGGTGKLPMSELRALCEELGFDDVKTYIQSGNVVFRSELSEARVKAALEEALAKKMGKPVAVLVRTHAELAKTLAHNPFPDASPSRVLVLFLDDKPPKGALDDVIAPGGEELSLHGRELFIHYPNGMGRSKLKVPFVKDATSRNVNTLTKLVEMAAALA